MSIYLITAVILYMSIHLITAVIPYMFIYLITAVIRYTYKLVPKDGGPEGPLSKGTGLYA
jgi:hypothetical protein